MTSHGTLKTLVSFILLFGNGCSEKWPIWNCFLGLQLTLIQILNLYPLHSHFLVLAWWLELEVGIALSWIRNVCRRTSYVKKLLLWNKKSILFRVFPSAPGGVRRLSMTFLSYTICKKDVGSYLELKKNMKKSIYLWYPSQTEIRYLWNNWFGNLVSKQVTLITTLFCQSHFQNPEQKSYFVTKWHSGLPHVYEIRLCWRGRWRPSTLPWAPGSCLIWHSPLQPLMEFTTRYSKVTLVFYQFSCNKWIHPSSNVVC